MENIKIYTYKDPHRIKERDFYNEIIKYPNLCASQTLKNGLAPEQINKETGYFREDYGYIYPVDLFMHEFFNDWLDPVTRIKQYISLNEYINKIESENIKESFYKNKGELIDSLRILRELNFDGLKSDNKILNEFIKIYEELISDKSDLWVSPLEFRNLNKEEFIERLETTFEYLYSQEIEENTNKSSANNMDTQVLKENINKNSFDTIVIHGLHRFDPLTINFIELLRERDIKIIFVINYISEFPEVYKSWREIYSLLGSFENSEEKLMLRNNLGYKIGQLLNGEIVEYEDDINFIKYDNISSFCDYVSSIYKETISDNDSENIDELGKIYKMREQFYSSSMTDVNNILKQYHPKQFAEKHFLAYPIGQFILSLYSMWDVESRKLLLDNAHLKECISLGFFKDDRYNALEVFNKLETYYKNLELVTAGNNIDEFIDEVERLHGYLNKLDESEKKNNKRTTLRRFSFYNISKEEIEYFLNIVEFIKSLSYEIFEDKDVINYYDHYKTLINLLDSEGLTKNGSEKEKKMLKKLDKELDLINDLSIEGTVDDLKSSLHYYLYVVEESESRLNQAKWIVRSFDHLDGGVMLGNATDMRKTYHLALTGGLDMNKSLKELLPWPLTEEFFEDNKVEDYKYKLFLKSYSNTSKYLRYSLFYASYFLNTKIKISYIENYPDEKNSLYYIWDMLSVDFIDDAIDLDLGKTSGRVRESSGGYLKKPLEDDQIRNFKYCNYKFILEEIVKGDTYFTNEYQQKLYYRTLVNIETIRRFKVKKISQPSLDEIKQEVTEVSYSFQEKYFNLWNSYIFLDVINKVTLDIKKQLEMKQSIFSIDDEYIDIRKKFIFGKIEDENGRNVIGDIYLNGYRKGKASYELIESFRNASSFKKTDQLVKCQLCGLSEICLERYRELI